jgi:hypothetical protein
VQLTANLGDVGRWINAPPAAVAMVTLGAFAWCRFARRAPYLQRMAILLGIALLGCLCTTLVFRWKFALGVKVSSLKGFPLTMVYIGSLHVELIPLAGATIALAIGAILGLAGYSAPRATAAPPPELAQGSPGESADSHLPR